MSNYTRGKVKRVTLDNNYVTIYDSMSQAAKENNINHAFISYACQTNTIYNGFKWEYEGKRLPKNEDLTGQVFNNFTVLKKSESKCKHTHWLCQCNCGSEPKSIRSSALKSGNTMSCGCLKLIGDKSRTHGKSKSTEYRTWSSIITRCYNTNEKRYNDWGGRGITVCGRWRHSFENFLEDMGDKPTPQHSLERINNDLGYYKENCKWATIEEQANNKRNNRIIEYNNEKKTLSQWCNILDLPYKIILSRISVLKWSTEKAFETSTNKKHIK